MILLKLTGLFGISILSALALEIPQKPKKPTLIEILRPLDDELIFDFDDEDFVPLQPTNETEAQKQ